jgi:hypothetical protein
MLGGRRDPVERAAHNAAIMTVFRVLGAKQLGAGIVGLS